MNSTVPVTTQREFFEVLRSRRSVRAFLDRPIDEEKLQQILEAMNSAPSAGNLQAYEVVLVRDSKTKTALARAALHQTFITQAPVVLAFCVHPQRSAAKYGRRGQELYCVQDATIACAYAQLAATALGLCSVWVGAFDTKGVGQALHIPHDWHAVALLPIGCPAESPEATARRRLHELVHEAGAAGRTSNHDPSGQGSHQKLPPDMNSTDGALPVGKLPRSLLARLLARTPMQDPRVVLGPGIGLDCAVVDVGSTLLVLKSDPITFATDEIGRYLVEINANDIATTGAIPRWLLMTLLLPEAKTTPELVERITEQVFDACREIDVTVLGGHTEITHGLDRPILVGTLIGEVQRERLVTPRGATPGDRLLLTKGVPIEATAILAREFPERLSQVLSVADLAQARNFLHEPGLSVLREARVAMEAGRVTAMHDPTEGGLSTALWELAEASDHSLFVDPAMVPVLTIAARICRGLGLDPLSAIASGALLLTAPPQDACHIQRTLERANIPCAEIGWVEEGPPAVWRKSGAGRESWPRPARDEIARVFEQRQRAHD